jgi:hypothetical protein
VNLMNTRTLAAALAGATLFGLTAVPARAQTAAPGVASPSADAKAAPKPKPKANRAGAVTVTVTVTNSRKVDLVQLQAAESGSADWKQVLGPVKSGKQASAKLPQASDCRFDLRGTFDDGQSMDASGIDVCADKTLNLTDRRGHLSGWPEWVRWSLLLAEGFGHATRSARDASLSTWCSMTMATHSPNCRRAGRDTPVHACS